MSTNQTPNEELIFEALKYDSHDLTEALFDISYEEVAGSDYDHLGSIIRQAIHAYNDSDVVIEYNLEGGDDLVATEEEKRSAMLKFFEWLSHPENLDDFLNPNG